MTPQLHMTDPLAEEIARRKAPSLWDSEAIGEFVERLIRSDGLTLEEAQARLELARAAKVAEVEDLLTLVLDAAEDEGGRDVDGWIIKSVRGSRRAHYARQEASSAVS
ncbi:hypothetical protein BSP109_02500 [Brevibacterium sp. Mu109]|uniref:hypothetical protein n=1 Tax=Brevibacterium sp. Mu109 TaxID=1255669 RepID=UPI000C3B2975|nr:hypothetical protein [Brevibacterium sp. Mu109]SMX90893.1 hypothetical protein BSP109_02500 [Brevibacterium sp. Mu109]